MVQLDINDSQSVQTLVQKLKDEKQSISVLINNAGVYFRGKLTHMIVNTTMQTNFFNTVNFTNVLLRENLIDQGGKIIMISSGLGSLSILEKRNPGLMEELSLYKTQLSMERLEEVAQTCLSELKDNSLCKNWPGSAYALSKLFLSI